MYFGAGCLLCGVVWCFAFLWLWFCEVGCGCGILLIGSEFGLVIMASCLHMFSGFWFWVLLVCELVACVLGFGFAG